jgi:hypothetical protein
MPPDQAAFDSGAAPAPTPSRGAQAEGRGSADDAVLSLACCRLGQPAMSSAAAQRVDD